VTVAAALNVGLENGWVKPPGYDQPIPAKNLYPCSSEGLQAQDALIYMDSSIRQSIRFVSGRLLVRFQFHVPTPQGVTKEDEGADRRSRKRVARARPHPPCISSSFVERWSSKPEAVG
jgi:hypothetical protein